MSMRSISSAYANLSLSKSQLLRLRAADTRLTRQYTILSQSSSGSEGGIGKADAGDELGDVVFIRVVSGSINMFSQV